MQASRSSADAVLSKIIKFKKKHKKCNRRDSNPRPLMHMQLA